MRGVKRCQESTGRMKKHCYSNGFKGTAVKLPNILAELPELSAKERVEMAMRPVGESHRRRGHEPCG